MTPEEVRARVEEIRLVGEPEARGGRDSDPERGHALEDELHREVLQAIANGAPNAPELAREALRSWEFDFSRWYA